MSEEMGNPQHEPTDEGRRLVELHIAIGTPQEDIARVLGIDAKTLRKHYREELDNGAVKANGEIGGALFKKAMDGDTTALIWWTKSRMRWKGTDGVMHSNDPDNPMPMSIPVHIVDNGGS